MDIKIINSEALYEHDMYMIMKLRLLNQKFKVKIWLRSNPTATRFSFWD